MMKENKFAQNLKAYRKMFKLSGLDLATAIDFGNATTISNYERGKRYPEENIIKRIADYFKITVDDLLYGETPDFTLCGIPLDDYDVILKMSEVGLPLYEVSEDELKINPILHKAYEKHKRNMDRYYSGGYLSNDELAECYELYAISYEKEKTVGSAANLLWFNSQTLFAAKMKTEEDINDFSDAVDAMIEKRKSVKSFIRDNLLEADYFDKESEETYEDGELLITDEEFDELFKKRYELFKFLKTDVKGSEYADFMFATQLSYALTSRRRPDFSDLITGRNLMNHFVLMGNKYALNYLVQCYILTNKK